MRPYRPGSDEWWYGEYLRDKLREIGLAITRYQAGEGAGSEAISLMRGNDKKWTVHQGAIYAPFVRSQSEAIDDLAQETDDCAFVLSLERGGTLVQDQIVSGTDIESHGVPKRSMTGSEIDAAVERGHISQEEAATLRARPNAHKIQQKADLRRAIDRIMAADPDMAVTIAIAETRVGGGSVNYVVGIANSIIREGNYPNLRFKILALDQTMHRDDGGAEGIFHAPVADADRIKVAIRSTEYILGEDVAYQLSHGSKHPIVVFKGTPHELAAYRITPEEETVSRDIIIDLVDGAYHSSLPGVL